MNIPQEQWDSFLSEWKEFHKEDQSFKAEMRQFKAEMLIFKDEMHQFKDEMLGFRQEMYQFKDEMLGFRQEMYQFKDEMLGFKQEMYQFKDEMLGFKQESLGRFAAIEARLDIHDKKLVDLKNSVLEVKTRFQNVESRLRVIDQRLDIAEPRLADIKHTLHEMDESIVQIRSRLDLYEYTSQKSAATTDRIEGRLEQQKQLLNSLSTKLDGVETGSTQSFTYIQGQLNEAADRLDVVEKYCFPDKPQTPFTVGEPRMPPYLARIRERSMTPEEKMEAKRVAHEWYIDPKDGSEWGGERKKHLKAMEELKAALKAEGDESGAKTEKTSTITPSCTLMT